MILQCSLFTRVGFLAEHYVEILEYPLDDAYYSVGDEQQQEEEEDSECLQDDPIRMGVGDLDHTMIYKLEVIRDPWWQRLKLYPQMYQKKHWRIIKKVLLAINNACGTELLVSKKTHDHQPSYHFEFYQKRIDLKPIDTSYYEARLMASQLDVISGKLVNLKNFWLIVDAHRPTGEIRAFDDITSIIPLDEVEPNQTTNSVIFDVAKYLLSVPYSCGGLVCKMSESTVSCACCKSNSTEEA